MILALGPGDFAAAMQTVFCLLALTMFGTFTFVYYAHCFFAIIESTSVGQHDVIWPDEPITDRFGKSFWLAWTILLCAAPAFVASAAFARQPLLAWPIGIAAFCLLLPVILLSLQTGNSFLAVFHIEAYRRLVCRPDYLLGYYASATIAFAILGIGVTIMFRRQMAMLPLGAPIAAYGLTLIARLYGRLAHLVSRVKVREPRTMVRRSTTLHRHPPVQKRIRGAGAGSEGEYGLRSTDAAEPESTSAPPSAKPIWVEEGADVPYEFGDGHKEAPKQILPKGIAEPSEYEMKLAIGSRPIPPPDHPWLSGTFTFPLQPSTWPAVVWLWLGLTVSGLCLRGMIG